MARTKTFSSGGKRFMKRRSSAMRWLVKKDSKLESGGGSLAESVEGTSGDQGPKLQGYLINGRDNFLDKHQFTRRDAYPGYLPEYASEMTGYLG
ncbi:MAG: hypothetical protein P8104_06540 [Gammaproteobacteria bacterium]